MMKLAPYIYHTYISRQGLGHFVCETTKSFVWPHESSSAFYRKLQKELEDYEFILNPEDPCVANKWTVDKNHADGGHQMTVIWHVDNLLASCKDGFKLTKCQCYLGKKYGAGPTINRGRKHVYIGMDLELCEVGAS